MNTKQILFIIGIAFVLIGLTQWQVQNNIIKRSAISVRVDTLALAQAVQKQVLSNAIDTLKMHDSIFARVIIRHDSILSARSGKAERRENTGRFLGGIIKGLFPGL